MPHAFKSFILIVGIILGKYVCTGICSLLMNYYLYKYFNGWERALAHKIWRGNCNTRWIVPVTPFSVELFIYMSGGWNSFAIGLFFFFIVNKKCELVGIKVIGEIGRIGSWSKYLLFKVGNSAPLYDIREWVSHFFSVFFV